MRDPSQLKRSHAGREQAREGLAHDNASASKHCLGVRKERLGEQGREALLTTNCITSNALMLHLLLSQGRAAMPTRLACASMLPAGLDGTMREHKPEIGKEGDTAARLYYYLNLH